MTPHAGEGVELGNTPPLHYGVQICIATLELELVVAQKIGNPSTSRLGFTALRHMTKVHSILP